MAFIDDFNSVVGSITDGFKNVWTTINTPSLKIPAVPSPAPQQTASGNFNTSSGVGSALQQAATAGKGISLQTALLGAAVIILSMGLILVRRR